MALQNFIPTLWDEKIQIEKQAADVFAANCNRKYEGELREKGDSVKILGVKKPTIHDSNTGEAISVTTEDVMDDSIIMPVKQIAWYSYGVSDFDRIQSIPGVMEAMRKSTGQSLSNKTDQYIAKLASDKLANKGSSTQVTENNILATIDGAIQKLYEANVPDTAKITLTLSPAIYFILKRAYANLDTNNHALIKNGTVGMYGKVEIKMSNNVYNDGTDDFCMVRTDEAIAYVESAVHSESFRPEGSFKDAIKGYILYDAMIVRPDELYVLKLHA